MNNNQLSEIDVTVNPVAASIDSSLSDKKIPTSGPQFLDVLNQHDLKIAHNHPTELQINLGKLCNLACHHCHVDAGPKRTEIMTWEVMEKNIKMG